MTDETRPTESYSYPPASVQPDGSTSPAQPGGVPGSSPFATAPAGQSPFAAPAAPPAPPVVAPPAKRRSGSSMLVNVLLGFALVVAVGGVAFAAGRATAPASTGTGRFGANGANGGFAGGFGPNASGAPNRVFGGGGAAGGAIAIQGKVTAVAADSITIQLPSGQTVTIPTSDQTTYHSQTSATASDVTSGADVIVQLSGGGRFTGGNGNGNGGNGNGNGQGNGNGGPAASGAPTGRGLGSASSVTIVPAGG